MPRTLASYSAGDWLRLRPLSQRYKSALWDRVDRGFTQRPGIDHATLGDLHARLKGHNLVVTIAWNSAWTIRWLLRFAERNVTNAAVLVADNSTDDAARAEIAALCDTFGVAYVGLPPNPYRTGRHPSRSHGLALNWVYRHVMRPLGPRAWALFDHDLYPTAPFDPEAQLRGQPFYGHMEVRPGGSYLWPGYALFARGVDRERPLDFRQDWFLGLDTGGMSASVYRRASLETMRFARTRSIGPGRNFAVTVDDLDWLDDCIHLGNASGWLKSNAEREPALDALLERILSGEIGGPFA